ncbi:DUF3305 domain-containing protein [Chelatococcus sp. SYSU_G07232]|uniref:DUF3305 domain-containing protein n=1 Tax=Chelatococcus albus TaxID=3047466 RepID=A0ABT7AJQ6_9HYPH|nr:DUF3305 domain-containing protein [Chelatococcus sp. SYSU_G07232]MDJ1159615.1 DUF3305 domain-containing protein [Chelatococcus sp. SYSU_G07232]
MAQERLTVGVVVERRKLSSPWADHIWLPVAVLPDAPDVAPWTPLGEIATADRFYVGAFDIDLYRTETANYRDNLASGEPKIWIAARADEGGHPIRIAGITADPAEGEAFTEAGDDTVEAVPMPPEIAARIAAFVAAHHVERVFFKRKRDRADPEALGARVSGPGRAEGEEE